MRFLIIIFEIIFIVMILSLIIITIFSILMNCSHSVILILHEIASTYLDHMMNIFVFIILKHSNIVKLFYVFLFIIILFDNLSILLNYLIFMIFLFLTFTTD